MKHSELQDIIREALLEVIEEGTAEDKKAQDTANDNAEAVRQDQIDQIIKQDEPKLLGNFCAIIYNSTTNSIIIKTDRYRAFPIYVNDSEINNLIRYEKLLSAVERHSNPEVGHYIERSWAAIFHPLLFTKII